MCSGQSCYGCYGSYDTEIGFFEVHWGVSFLVTSSRTPIWLHFYFKLKHATKEPFQGHTWKIKETSKMLIFGLLKGETKGRSCLNTFWFKLELELYMMCHVHNRYKTEMTKIWLKQPECFYRDTLISHMKGVWSERLVIIALLHGWWGHVCQYFSKIAD